MTLYVAFMCAQDISNRNTAWKNCNNGEIKLVYIHLKFRSKPLSLRKGLCTPQMLGCLKSTVQLNQLNQRSGIRVQQNRRGWLLFSGFSVLSSCLFLHFCVFTLGILRLFGMKPGQNSEVKKYGKEQYPEFSWCENKCYLSISSLLLEEVTRSYHSLELFFMA